MNPIIISLLVFLTVCSILKEMKPVYGNFTHRSTENNESGVHLKNRSLRYQKVNIFRHFHSSLVSWTPFKVNESCPIFVVESDRKEYFIKISVMCLQIIVILFTS